MPGWTVQSHASRRLIPKYRRYLRPIVSARRIWLNRFAKESSMNELDTFCPPPKLTATPRQVERGTQLFWESANAASPGLFQQVTSQLLALFRAQGCALL